MFKSKSKSAALATPLAANDPPMPSSGSNVTCMRVQEYRLFGADETVAKLSSRFYQSIAHQVLTTSAKKMHAVLPIFWTPLVRQQTIRRLRLLARP
jgi:hypothetical protein